MAIQSVFPSLIYQAKLSAVARLKLNLLNEINHLIDEDQAGQQWSAKRYPGGYTSYGSVSRLHEFSPTFHKLQMAVDPHLQQFSKKLGLDTRRSLSMTDCWVNVMPAGVHHGWHIHPQSVISGTVYLKTPQGSAPIKFEDPRLDKLMASPLSRERQNKLWLEVKALEGSVVLFESWMRHEVPINRSKTPRISISFNYSFF
jgi:uncharacterized protein (TIGR02466 family)